MATLLSDVMVSSKTMVVKCRDRLQLLASFLNIYFINSILAQYGLCRDKAKDLRSSFSQTQSIFSVEDS